MKNFIVYKSSAGSGKTYTLALNFICISITGASKYNIDYYKKILAITFTNKASAEMKERVLLYFSKLSNGEDIDNILSFVLEETKLSKDEVFRLSSSIFSHILHHYSDLNISTIDKFTYTIVKTFASDLGLSNTFNLELDNSKIINPSVALLLNKISEEDTDLVNVLLEFSLQKISDGSSNNIENDLKDFAKHLFKEDSSGLDLSLDLKEFIQIKDELILKKNQLLQNINEIRIQSVAIFDHFNLTKEHFLRGTYYNLIIKKLNSSNYKDWIPSDSLIENMKNDKWYKETLDNELKLDVEKCKPQLIKIIDTLLDTLKKYISVYVTLKKIYPNIIINELVKEIHSFKKENNLEHISEFNTRINKLILKQSSLFIFERIGERFNHFLIDEFQDTSILQWQNLLPLITDSLDFGKNIIVGDGKQSIYRWRGGEVQQFLNLPKIYNVQKLEYSADWQNKLTDHYIEKELIFNFRSKKEIINFNNLFFAKIKKALNFELQELYSSPPQDAKFSSDGGYIEIDLFESEEWREEILKKISSEILKLVNKNNYSFKDCAILCNSNADVSKIATYLNEISIPVVSSEGLLVSNSKKVNFIIAFLSFLKNPNNLTSQAHIITYLKSVNLLQENLHQLFMQIKEQGGLFSVLKKYNFSIDVYYFQSLSIYELVLEVITQFNLGADVYLDSFVDNVHNYSLKNLNSLSDFLIWWEDHKEKKYVTIDATTDAVTILTIHKSKGLSFNNVFIPFDWRGGNKKEIWVNNPGELPEKLTKCLITENKSLVKSSFRDQLDNEKELTLLDNINQLYVAMTRPKNRLYIYSKSLPKKPSDSVSLNTLLSFFTTSFPVIIGDSNESFIHEKTINNNNFIFKNIVSQPWREIISLKNSSLDIWDLENNDSKKDWGSLLHLILSRIHFIEDKDKVLEQALRGGLCSAKQFKRLSEELDEIFNDPSVQRFFTNEWEVITEKEILDQSGETYIPDRLLFNNDNVVVIDYKTGEYNNLYNKQILNYASILNQMGYKKIECYLIYTMKKNKVQKI